MAHRAKETSRFKRPEKNPCHMRSIDAEFVRWWTHNACLSGRFPRAPSQCTALVETVQTRSARKGIRRCVRIWRRMGSNYTAPSRCSVSEQLASRAFVHLLHPTAQPLLPSLSSILGLDVVADKPLQQEGDYELARYNPPFTIPWFKTNEIHLALDEACSAKI